MWTTKNNRIVEIAVIVVVGAIISVLNTLWLRESLLKQIERIAKINETNIINRSKVSHISEKMDSKSN